MNEHASAFDEFVDEPQTNVAGEPNGRGGSDDTGHKHRFRLEPFEEIELGDEPEWLVEHILPAKGLAVVYGEPGSGKSFLAEDLALSVARNVPWGGKTVQGGAVVYITAEGATGFRKRLVAYRQHYGVTGPVPFMLLADTPNLGRPEGDAEALIRDIADQITGQLRIVVVDTLARTMAGADENSATDMAVFVANCERLERALGCLVLVVHHAGKDATKGARGSSVLKAAEDLEIMVNGTEERRTATITKAKDGETGLSFTFRLSRVDLDHSDRDVSSCILEPLSEWTAGAVSHRKPQAKGPAKVALDALHRALADAGEHMPGTGQRASVRGCPVSLWRRYCEQVQITEADTPEAKRKAFARAAQKLQEFGIVGVFDDVAWINE